MTIPDGILQQLLDAYKQQHGTEPTEDVVKQWIGTISDANLSMNDIAGAAEAGEEPVPATKRAADTSSSAAPESKRQKQDNQDAPRSALDHAFFGA